MESWFLRLDNNQCARIFNFRVFGTKRLRVIDGSLLRINEANTNDVTARMIGELGSHVILNTDWRFTASELMIAKKLILHFNNFLQKNNENVTIKKNSYHINPPYINGAYIAVPCKTIPFLLPNTRRFSWPNYYQNGCYWFCEIWITLCFDFTNKQPMGIMFWNVLNPNAFAAYLFTKF